MFSAETDLRRYEKSQESYELMSARGPKSLVDTELGAAYGTREIITMTMASSLLSSNDTAWVHCQTKAGKS